MSERENLKQYCKNCTDEQLVNVYRLERQRARNHQDSPVGKTARLFARMAKDEMERRGLSE